MTKDEYRATIRKIMGQQKLNKRRAIERFHAGHKPAPAAAWCSFMALAAGVRAAVGLSEITEMRLVLIEKHAAHLRRARDHR